MKRFFCILLLTPLLLVGCTESDVEDTMLAESGSALSADAPILFNSSVESISRAAMVETASDMGSIGIYGAYTGEVSWSSESDFSLMNNHYLGYSAESTEWQYNDGEEVAWGHTSLYDRYTFFGYSPHSTESKYIIPSIVNGELVVDYVTAELATDHIDLMLAQPRKDIYPQVGGNVALTFDHALSAICFKAKGLTGSTITSISLSGFDTEGRVTFTESSIEWSALSESTPVVIPNAGLSANQDLNISVASYVTSDDGYLMMIPQTIPDDAVVTITAKMSSESSSELTTTLDFSQTSITKWEPSMCYTYTFVIDSEITIDKDVTVTDWVDENVDVDTSTSVTVNPADWLNLDFYNSVEEVSDAVTELMERGVTELIVVGTYFDGALGYGSSVPNTNTNPLCASGIYNGETTTASHIDISRVVGIADNRIPDYAFYRFTSLTNIVLPSYVTSIGEYCFISCSALHTVDNTSGLLTIEYCGFNNCDSLVSIDLPNVKELNDYAFSGSNYLQSVNCPNVTYIGNRAFYYCHSLSSIDLSNVETIGSYAFYGCILLPSVDVSNVTELGEQGFCACYVLTAIDMPKLTTLNYYSFLACYLLSDVNLPNVTSVGYSAFANISTDATIRLTVPTTTESPMNIVFRSSSDDWSEYNLVLHESTVLDSTFIVTSSTGTTLTYGDGGIGSNNYIWKSVTYVDDDGNIVVK